MAWNDAHRDAARAATERRIESYCALVAALLAADPKLRTEDLADKLGYDRSTVRRWRRILRESSGAPKNNP